MALRGRFHDGETATEHLVEVTPGADGLDIVGAGVRVFWRRQDMHVIDRGGGHWRLGVSTAPDARLVLAKSAEVDAALRSLGVVSRDALRGGMLVGGLIAAGLALAALVFVAIPLAAEPLARLTPHEVETRLGDNVGKQVNVFMRPCPAAAAADNALAPLLQQLETAASPGFEVKVTFVRTKAPNAFAMPGGRVMVTSGLLETLDDPEELAAVLAHEIGHVKARDGMVALYRNAGLGILLEIVTGGSGVAQQVVLLGGQLAEMRYTRGQEERADVSAIATMRASGYDPAALARAFEALKVWKSEEERPGPSRLRDLDIPEWLQSHPGIDRRIARARAAATPATNVTLSPEAWEIVKRACG